MRIVAILVTIYVLVSLVTYSTYDPGLHSTSSNTEIANLGGSVGANIAGVAVWVFGFVPILIVTLLLVRLILEWLRGSMPRLARYFNSATDLFGYLIIWCGLLGGLIFAAGLESAHNLGAASSIGKTPGGVVGGIMAATTQNLFGNIGSSVLLLVGFIGCITWLIGVRWLPLMDRTGEIIVDFFTKVKAKFKGTPKEGDVGDADDKNRRRSAIAAATVAGTATTVIGAADKISDEAMSLPDRIKKWWQSFHVLHKDDESTTTDEELAETELSNSTADKAKLNLSVGDAEYAEGEGVSAHPSLSTNAIKEERSTGLADSDKNEAPKLNRPKEEGGTASLRVPQATGTTEAGLRLRSADSYSETGSNKDQVEKWRRRAKRNAIPPIDLLENREAKGSGESKEYRESMIELIEENLGNFNISAEVKNIQTGPVITRYELEPAAGVKVSQISNLSNDLARAMSVKSVRVVENIPGTTYVGLEVPTRNREIVSFKHGVASKTFKEHGGELPLMLGDDITGKTVVADLAKMPHLLVAGTTGSGKSVCINALIASLLYKCTPQQVRFILIDPKMLELSVYEGIPHLLAPVVTDMQQAGSALRWALAEMEQRYKIMSALKVRNIGAFNEKIEQARENNEAIIDPMQKPGEEPVALEEMPYIVIVIDELADLLMVVGKKVEELIARLAQKARAAGIHLILATQRPSVDVITGLIKANVPTRIAFQVSSKVDSRTVLDQMGAEQLLGHGDMLFLPPGSGHTQRVHGAFLSDDEVGQIVEFLKVAGDPDYVEGVLHTPEQGVSAAEAGSGGEEDEYYDQALAIVTKTRRASISAVQRQLRIGYNRAARIIEAMEAAGVVGPMQSNGSREVLAPESPSDDA